MKPYFDNVLSHYAAIRALQHGEMPAPEFCTMHASYQCNHRCTGCSYGGKLNGAIMPRQRHLSLLKELVELGLRAVEYCGGGEPLTIPYLNEALEYVSSQGCAFGMLTNGSLFNDGLIDLFVARGTYTRISLEASDCDAYTAYRRVATREWHRVLEAICELTERKRVAESSLDVGLKFAVGKTLRGTTHYANAVALANWAQVSNAQFKALRHLPEELTLDELVTEEALLARAAECGKVPVISALRRKHSVPQCWLNPLHTVIDAHGDVYLCCYYYYRAESHRIGNIMNTPFKDVWYSDKHREAIAQIRRDDCAQVDCKFFGHHETVERAFTNRRVDFL